MIIWVFAVRSFDIALLDLLQRLLAAVVMPLVMHQHPLHPPKLLFFVAASSVLIPVSQPIEASAGIGSCTPAQSIAKASEKTSRTGTAISYPATACWVLMTWVYLLCSMKFVQKSWEKYTNNVAYPYGFADSRSLYLCSGISPQSEKLPRVLPGRNF